MNGKEEEVEISGKLQRAGYRGSSWGIPIYWRKAELRHRMLLYALLSESVNCSYLCSEFVSKPCQSPCPCCSCQQILHYGA